MDKLKAFESFVSVATRGSLTAAAKAEGVAPAIMGRRLDALEEHLGVKLLVRTTRRISLTHEGSAFLEDCQRLLSDVANAEASVSEGGVKATGHLRITAPAGFGRRRVAVHQQAPGVALDGASAHQRAQAGRQQCFNGAQPGAGVLRQGHQARQRGRLLRGLLHRDGVVAALHRRDYGRGARCCRRPGRAGQGRRWRYAWADSFGKGSG